MDITLLCSSPDHPVNAWLERWKNQQSPWHDVTFCRVKQELPGGDILFLISCSQIIDAQIRSLYRHTMVLHASDLPNGRGWSPYIWELLNGAESITVSLLDAADKVDAGAIWAKRTFAVPRHALQDEIHAALFETEMALMDEALVLVTKGAKPVEQPAVNEASYYRKRTPADSEIDPSLPLSQLFNTIRLMDPQRYPAFFCMHGHTYTVEIKKVASCENDHD